MARLLSLALLSLNAVVVHATVPSPLHHRRMPFVVPRGGGGDESGSSSSGAENNKHTATTIPAGGASSYASQLEEVKAAVLEAASDSVRCGTHHVEDCMQGMCDMRCDLMICDHVKFAFLFLITRFS